MQRAKFSPHNNHFSGIKDNLLCSRSLVFNQKFRYTFSEVNGIASSTNSGKEDNLGSYTQIFENLSKGTLFHLIFIPKIFGLMVRISDFPETFQGDLRTTYYHFKRSEIFGSTESVPKFN